MHKAFCLVLAALAAAPAAQDDAEARKARKEKVRQLQKTVSGGDAAGKLAAIDELSGIDDDEARSLLARKMVEDTAEVRIAAAGALAKHRRAYSIKALDNALGSNLQSPEVFNACVDALVKLDMCATIPVLVAAIRANKHAYAEKALEALAGLGCPEASEGLLQFLALAEKEERKPDTFVETDEEGNVIETENKTKDKRVAALAGPVRETLGRVTGQSFGSLREWTAWARNGERQLKLQATYLCNIKGETFDVPAGKARKCPYAEGKSNHTDSLLKHRRE